MNRLNIVVTVWPFALLAIAQATIIHVPAEYGTIQAGVDASSDGDTVLVHPGTYYENVDFNGHSILLGSWFILTGDSADIYRTVIDGDSSGSVVTLEDTGDTLTAITGLTLRRGFALCGGAVRCDHSVVLISHNVIYGNTARYAGGGIDVYGGSVRILDNVFTGNTATDGYDGKGGAICCEAAALFLVEGNVITKNSSFG